MDDLIYRAIAILAVYNFDKCQSMKFSELANKLSDFFGEEFSGKNVIGRNVDIAYKHYEGYEDIQKAIKETFVKD